MGLWEMVVAWSVVRDVWLRQFDWKQKRAWGIGTVRGVVKQGEW
jgi:hypothetical protein